jgi:hypothetical protein
MPFEAGKDAAQALIDAGLLEFSGGYVSTTSPRPSSTSPISARSRGDKVTPGAAAFFADVSGRARAGDRCGDAFLVQDPGER